MLSYFKMNLLSFTSNLSPLIPTKSNSNENENVFIFSNKINFNDFENKFNQQEKDTVWILRDDFKNQILKNNILRKSSFCLLTSSAKSTKTIPNNYIADAHYPSNIQGKKSLYLLYF
jgi:hypothetical protein